MNIEITIGGPLADAIQNLAAALQTSGLIERAQTSSQPKAPKKSKPVEADAAIPVSEEKQDVAEIPATEEKQEVSAAPISKKDLQTLASAKSKKVGVEKVKEIIGQYGGKTINDTNEEQLAALKTALEQL